VSTINIVRYISIFKKISIEAKITRKVKWMVIYKVYVVFTDWTYYHSLICQHHFQQYFSYIMATSFSGGRSQSTRKAPSTMGKQLVNFITCGCESSASFF
jgi:hypothetical protein